MNVYVLEQGVDGVSSEVVGVVSNEDVARLFCSTNPKERMYTQKWLDDSNLLYGISKEGGPYERTDRLSSM